MAIPIAIITRLITSTGLEDWLCAAACAVETSQHLDRLNRRSQFSALARARAKARCLRIMGR
jgi:hypothetical protein